MSAEDKRQAAYFAVDLETSGLRPERDGILEIAWTFLDLEYNQLAPIRSLVVRPGLRTRVRLEENAFVRDMHERSGLLAAIDKEGAVPIGEALGYVTEDIAHWTPEDERLVIFGSSVHTDQRFLFRWGTMRRSLHYRVHDVSTILAHHFGAGGDWPARAEIAHRAADDIAWSIAQARERLVALQSGYVAHNFAEKLIQEMREPATLEPPITTVPIVEGELTVKTGPLAGKVVRVFKREEEAPRSAYPESCPSSRLIDGGSDVAGCRLEPEHEGKHEQYGVPPWTDEEAAQSWRAFDEEGDE